MQVSKWGNSLAARLPASIVRALDLKEGDNIEIRIARTRNLEVSKDKSREWALARLRQLRRPLPPDFFFDREEIHERGANIDVLIRILVCDAARGHRAMAIHDPVVSGNAPCGDSVVRWWERSGVVDTQGLWDFSALWRQVKSIYLLYLS
jgi:antitoxin MazE